MSQEALTQLDTNTTEALPLPSPAAPAQPLSMGPEPLSMGAVLKIVTLRRLWFAQIVSVFGDFLALFAVITIMTFTLRATPQQVTGLNIAYLLPIALLGVISGVFVDRWPVKVTLVSSDLLRAALCLLLLLVHNVYGFYAVLASISVVSSFFGPAQGVAIRSAVPMHGLRSANALMQQVMFIMRIIGGPIAITLVNLIGAHSCYLIDAVSFVASGSLIASLTLAIPQKTAAPPLTAPDSATPTPQQQELAGVRRILADMKVGAGFILHHAGLLFVIVALAAAMFVMGCFGPLIAIYVRDTLRSSTTTFAFASAMIGVGLLLGVNALNAFAKRIANATQVYLGLAGIAVGTGLLAAAPYFRYSFKTPSIQLLHLSLKAHHPSVAGLVAIGACFVIGFAVAGIIVPSQTLIQEETPHELMGRVGSTVMSAIFSAQILGLLLSGVLAERTSVRSVFTICTGMLAALILAGKLWMEPEEHATAA